MAEAVKTRSSLAWDDGTPEGFPSFWVAFWRLLVAQCPAPTLDAGSQLLQISQVPDGEMNLQRAFGLPFILAFGVTLSGQQAGDLQQMTNGLAALIYTGPSMKTLRELTDGVGGRLTGSPAHQRAADWAASKFRSFGVTNVRLEAFTIPNGWQRGSARGEILAPTPRALRVESLGWSPPTPPGGIKGDVMLIADLDVAKLKAQSDQIKGKIVMLDTPKIFAEGYVKALPKLHCGISDF